MKLEIWMKDEFFKKALKFRKTTPGYNAGPKNRLFRAFSGKGGNTFPNLHNDGEA